MLKISLPVQPINLSQMLFQQNSHIIDMELADRYGCSIVVGSFREINDAREKLGLGPVKELRHSEVGNSNYACNFQDVTISLHHRKAAFLSSFIHPYKEKYFSGCVAFDLFIKGTTAEDKVLVIRRTGVVPHRKVEKMISSKDFVNTAPDSTEQKKKGTLFKDYIERFAESSDDLFKMIGKTFSGAMLGVVIIACVSSFINKEKPIQTDHEKLRLNNDIADAIQKDKKINPIKIKPDNIEAFSYEEFKPEIQ